MIAKQQESLWQIVVCDINYNKSEEMISCVIFFLCVKVFA